MHALSLSDLETQLADANALVPKLEALSSRVIVADHAANVERFRLALRDTIADTEQMTDTPPMSENAVDLEMQSLYLDFIIAECSNMLDYYGDDGSGHDQP